MTTSARGSCYCGSVQFSVQLPVKWCAHCHCSICRRMHGAAFVTWFGVAREQCTLNEDDVIWYSSSAEAERGHCRHCASQLFFRSSRWPGELHIALAAISDDIEMSPQAHVFTESAVPWLSIGDDLPRFKTLPEKS